MIKQAIIPLAGLGTRLLPLTSVFAKELLPINGKPGLEYILNECIDAGIKEIIFVISKKKKIIKKYFYNDAFYKNIIKKKKDTRIIKEYKKILYYKKKIKFVYQNKPLGTGDAVLKAKKYIKDMISVHNKYKSSVMASLKVKKKTVNRWGIYSSSKNLDKKNFLIKQVIEKPEISKAPSNNAVIGRYILPKTIFKFLKNQNKGKSGEVHITDAIQRLINIGSKFVGHKFSGSYLDCGTINGYIQSSLEVSKK